MAQAYKALGNQDQKKKEREREISQSKLMEIRQSEKYRRPFGVAWA